MANRLSIADVYRDLTNMGAVGVVVRSVSQALKTIAVGGVREHFRDQRDPDGNPWKKLARPRPDGSERVLQDKGTLSASVRAEVDGTTLTLTASHVAANVHQYGARVRPKSAKYLALPLTVEAKRAGSPRRFKGGLFSVRAGDTLLLVDKPAGGGGGKRKARPGKAQYVLVKEVTIPARPYLGFSEKTLGAIEETVSDSLARWVANPWQSEIR